MEKVYEIFDEVQRSASSHRNCMKKLTLLLNQQQQNDTNSSALIDLILRGCLDKVLIYSKKEVTVERVIKFFCDYISSTSTEQEELFRLTIEHLLASSNVLDKTIRYRSCQIIAGILSNMSGDTEISDELWLKMIKYLQPRLMDKAPNVRLWAVKAVQRLQNQTDENDQIMLKLLMLMNCDTSKDVRVAAVETICICKVTLPALVERIKDTKSEVRVAVLNHLAKDVDVRHLTSDQRALIIINGLNDRDPTVSKATKELIFKWLDRSALDNRVHKLLQLINLQYHEDEAELVGLTIMSEVDAASSEADTHKHAADLVNITQTLKQAVKQQHPDWSKGFKAIAPSEILWALLRCEYAFANFNPTAANEVKDALIPDTVQLCSLLSEAKRYDLVENIQYQLTVKYLLRMTAFIDSSDISGNEELISVCKQMMFNTKLPESLVESVLSAWWRGSGLQVVDGVKEILKSSQDIVASSFIPVADNSVQNDVNEEEELVILASIRSLLMIEWSFQRVAGKNININDDMDTKELLVGIRTFIIESLQQPIVELRGLSVRCLGLLSLYSHEYCDEYHEIIIQVARTDMEDPLVRCQAIQALCDMSIVYEQRYQDDAAITNLLLRLCESGDLSLLRVAAESACKLLFIGRLSDSRLLANLMKFFFVPEIIGVTESDEYAGTSYLGTSTHLQQMLSVFFQTYFTMNGISNPSSSGTPSRQQIALDAVSDLISDIAMLVRNADVEASYMNRIINNLYMLINENIVSNNSGSSDSSSSSDSSGSSGSNVSKLIDRFHMKITASIGMEVLKLGVRSAGDKATAKEYIKILANVNVTSWLHPHISNSVYKMGAAIAKNFGHDKASLKIIHAFCQACSSVTPTASDAVITTTTTSSSSSSGNADDDEPVVNEFVHCILGLADILDSFDDDITIAEPTATAATSKRQTKKVIKDDSDGDSDDDNGEEGNDDDAGGNENVNATNAQDGDTVARHKSTSSRVCKSVASKNITKMAALLHAE